MRPRLPRRKSITRPPKQKKRKCLRFRRPRRKADPMTKLDPVTPPEDPAEPIATPVVAAPPRKSRAGLFFFGVFSGCLVVFVGIVLFGVLIMAMTNDDATTRGDVFGDKVAIIPI